MRQNIPVIHGQFQNDINYSELIKVDSVKGEEKVPMVNDKINKIKIKSKNIKYRR